MKVVFTAAAERGLIAIADHIAQDDPARALRFVRLLRDKALSLARFPEAFPVMARYRQAGIRRYAFGNYLILYRVRADQVVVLLIVHAAQDYDRLLRE